MKKVLLAIILLVGNNLVRASGEVVIPAGVVIPDDLKNLQWNRYTTENFTILSIDDSQGKWLAGNLDKIKTWCITRWGFPDVKFVRECRVMCVPNKVLMKKLFNLTESKCEVRYKDGVIEISAIWLILDNKPARTIPIQLSKVCLTELEQKHNFQIAWFASRGISLLNGTIPEIRQQIASLGLVLTKNQSIFVSEKMFTMTEEEYKKLTPEEKIIFDSQAVVLCLMLRKEFGEAKLQGLLRISSRNKIGDVLRLVYGFRSFQHFDGSYAQYMKDLTNDVITSRTPDSYLEIKPVR